MGRRPIQGTEDTKKEAKDVEAILNYCNGCLKFNAAKRKCKVLTDPFPLWSDKEKVRHNHSCWAREENPVKLAGELEQTIDYQLANDPGRGCLYSEKVTSAREEIEALRKITDKEFDEVRSESDRTGFPWIYAMGGSSNKDGSMFGKESQKDNRMMHRKLDPKREDWNDKKK